MRKFPLGFAIAVGLLTGMFITLGSVTHAIGTPIQIFGGGTGSTTAPVSQLLYGGATAYQSVATTTVICTGNTTCTAFTVIGSVPITISSTGGGTGLSTSSPISAGNVLVYSATGAGYAYGIATSSATINNGLTGLLTTLGSGQTIGLATINAGVLGAVINGLVPTSQATSTLYGTGVGGQVLGWNNTTGGIAWVATSTSGGSGTPGGTTSQVQYNGSGSVFAGVSTTTLSVGTGLTNSGTLGALVGGSAASISFAAINANTLWANNTGASAVPTAIATSSLFAGTTGQLPYFSAGGLIGTTTLFLTTGGVLGIGTNLPTGVNANAKLTVAGISSQDIIASTSDNTTLSDAIFNAYAPGSRVFVGAHGTNQVSSRYGITLGGWGEIGGFNSTLGTTNGLIIGTNPSVPLVFGTNNIERARFSGGGGLGIGMTNPGALVELQGTSTAATGATLIAWDSTSNPLLYVRNDGLVGIGTSTPGTTLSIGNTGANTINISPTATSTFGSGLNLRTGCFAINSVCVGGGSGSGTVTSITLGGGLDGLSPITTSGTITAQIGTSSVPTLGQIPYWTGIGTPSTLGTTATSSLTATGLLSISNSPSIIGTSGAVITLPVTKGNFVVGNDAGTAQATSTIFISSTGSVGIASTTPHARLSVNSPSTANVENTLELSYSTGAINAATTTILKVASTTAGAAALVIGATTTPSAYVSIDANGITTALLFAVGSSTATAFSIDTANHVFAPNTTSAAGAQTGYWCYDASGQLIRDSAVCIVSALKFKKDIATLSSDYGLSAVLAMTPVTYYKKEPLGKDDRGQQIGFIADWSELTVPQLVTHDSNGEVRGFNYEQYTAVLTKGVQDFYKQFQLLLARVTGIEQRLDAQQKEIDALKAEIKKLQ